MAVVCGVNLLCKLFESNYLLQLSKIGLRRREGTDWHEWSEIKRVIWPTDFDSPIVLRLSNEQDVLSDFLDFSFHLKGVAFDDRLRLIRAIWQRLQHASHENWPQFCLKFGMPLLYLHEEEKSKVMFGDLRGYLENRLERRRCQLKLYRDVQTKFNNHLVGLIQILVAVHPNLYFSFAGAIAYSAIVNSYLITMSWCTPVVEICLGFSAILFAIGLTGLGLSKAYDLPLVKNGNANKLFSVLYLAIFVVFIVAFPAMLYWMATFKTRYAEFLLPLLFFIVFSPLFIEILRLNIKSKRYDQESLQNASVDVWEKTLGEPLHI